MDNYAYQMNKDIESMKNYIVRIFGEDIHYQILRRENLPEMYWIGAAYYLSNNMEGKARTIDYFGGVFFFDDNKNALRSVFSDYSFSGDNYRLNQCLKNYLRDNKDLINHEDIFVYEKEAYLVYTYGVKGKRLGFIINLDRYFEKADELQFVLYDKDRKIISNTGEKWLEDDKLHKAVMNENSMKNGINYLISSTPIDILGLRLAGIRHEGIVHEFWKYWEFWLLFILLPSITIVGFLNIHRVLNKILLHSVDHLMERITDMKIEGNSEKYENNKKIKEFKEINDKLDEMIKEIENLQEEKFKKEMEVNAAQLQYYQLQVNPHFFLNCLNIVDSLLNNNNVYTVKSMISALSKHFRYVFQDRSYEVTVREEIEEIKDYCNIYIIKGGVPILFQSEVDEDTIECKIPILCIQTFVENSIKYANDKEHILSIKVVIQRITDGVEEFLCIRISDNGMGYPVEKLQELNTPITEFQYFSQHVGIDNIKYRIYLMYGENAKLYFYNGSMGEAVTEILLPVKRLSNNFSDQKKDGIE